MNIKELLSELLQFSKEREWFEFKENWFKPIALGEYVSALSNAAALVGKEFAYFVCVSGIIKTANWGCRQKLGLNRKDKYAQNRRN